MDNKTLGTIMEEVMDGLKPEYDDLRYALIAMSSLRIFDSMALYKLWDKERNGKYNPKLFGLEWQANESHNRTKTAFGKPPKEWLGTNHDPDCDECQRFRKGAKNLLSIVEKRMEDGK